MRDRSCESGPAGSKPDACRHHLQVLSHGVKAPAQACGPLVQQHLSDVCLPLPDQISDEVSGVIRRGEVGWYCVCKVQQFILSQHVWEVEHGMKPKRWSPNTSFPSEALRGLQVSEHDLVISLQHGAMGDGDTDIFGVVCIVGLAGQGPKQFTRTKGEAAIAHMAGQVAAGPWRSDVVKVQEVVRPQSGISHESVPLHDEGVGRLNVGAQRLDHVVRVVRDVAQRLDLNEVNASKVELTRLWGTQQKTAPELDVSHAGSHRVQR